MTEKISVDTDCHAEKAWVLGVQRKLYQQSKANPDIVWRDLWGWLTDSRTIRHAWQRVSSNKGKRSAGVDGITVEHIRRRIGEQKFLDEIRTEMRSGAYRPSPSRRKLIPKPGKPGQFRPLGIPTVKDRVVQGAVKTILEPIFEAQFWPVSYGFRPGRSTHGALEHIRLALQTRKREKDSRRLQMPYSWIIEGDIKGCFDNINHHHLMDRLRKRIADRRVTGLIGQFLKAGVLAENRFLRSEAGTPQGGIISPLLANIALSAIEERYERWTYHRKKIQERRLCDGAAAAMGARNRDRRAGRCIFFPIRYADDFVVLVSGSQENAIMEKSELADYLRQTTGLELSPEKTKVTAVTEGFEFLGFHVVMRWDKRYGYFPRVEIPKAKASDLRHTLKRLTKVDTNLVTLGKKLTELNFILRGWTNYYRYCARAGKVFTGLDWFVTRRLWCWLRRKRRKARVADIMRSFARSSRRPTRKVWQEGTCEQYILAWTPVCRFKLGWMKQPDFAQSSGEPDAYRKTQVRFGEGR
jgi:RNA-directed DNA polymerase